MGIFSVFRSRDKPKNLGGGAAFLMGRSNAGTVVNEQTAMQLTAVYACVRVLAESIAGLPLHLYEYEGTGKKKATSHLLYRLMHDRPNPEMTSFVFRETMMTHLLLSGNAYAHKIFNNRGDLIALYPLMPNRVSVERDADKRIIYRYTFADDDAEGGYRVAKLSRSEVFHIPGLGFNGLVGFSPIAMAKNALGMGMAAEEFGSKFFANGAQPSGVLEHPGVLKDHEKLRTSWQAAFGGSSNSNKVAVLEEGLKYTPISLPPDQAQFLETRKFQVNEIARMFRVPPHMIGDLEKSSFSNIEHQSIEFVMYTLNAWVARWEQSMFSDLLPARDQEKYFWKFNVDGLLRGDYLSRMNGYAIARQNGWMSADDIRELENMDKLPEGAGGDLYLINGNMLPLNMAGAFANHKKGGKADE